jgi:hypothetical protein
MTISLRRCSNVVLVGLFILVGTSVVFAQESKSVAAAKELTQLLDQAKLDSVAARDPNGADTYVAALYFPGSQLLVVSAKYSVPVLLNERLAKKEYREIYIDLNSASVPESRIFVGDLGANGLVAKPGDNQPFDSFEKGGKRYTFDGDWKKQKLSEDDYLKGFADADTAYAALLKALTAQLKK